VSVIASRNDSPGYVCISVADTGIGIESDQVDKVFDRFYQVDMSHTREQGGTGIGLALTKELVELHQGEITVTSEPGKGSTFTVRLPMGKERVKPEDSIESVGLATKDVTPIAYPIQADDGSATDGTGNDGLPVLLIVEDSADMLKYIRRHLADGYRIIEAMNGEEGIRKATESIPDLIISDVMMPRMDGFQLCRKLKTDECTSHIPVILLTAKAESEQKIEGLETGADDYIMKPFEARELQVRVKNLIEQRRKLRERFAKARGIQLKEIVITPADERFMNRVIEIVETHISDRDFTAEQFAREMFLSRMQLHRKIRALTNLSPWQFVRKVRLHRAADMLRKHAGNISEIAYQIGYESPSKFSEAFRQEFGYPPSGHKP
jgi:DNA-binding response OmpR family regulator